MRVPHLHSETGAARLLHRSPESLRHHRRCRASCFVRASDSVMHTDEPIAERIRRSSRAMVVPPRRSFRQELP